MTRILGAALLSLGLAACVQTPDNVSPTGSTSGGSAGASTSSSGSGSSSTGGTSGGSSTGGTTGSGCPLAVNTTPTSTATGGCALLDRDTSACQASREAQGLSGAWLRFSCRVTLSVSNGVVTLSSDGQPDYASNYFPTSSACYAAYAPAFPDPNQIAAQSLSVHASLTPDASAQAMGLGPVGMALNGVALFDNQAAPGDDIFRESGSFDECQGHPQQQGMYHYHSEPYALSSDDARLIGVLRDGYFVYGRRDADGSVPTDLDAAGGHVGTTPDSPSTPVYHHHLNLETSTNAGTAGQQVWFITTGQYAGTPR